ncbi:molybdopterin molybdotransferase MoeA [Dehalobacterium formicoaceticum]|uniref:Molybdopterin molybdenumtransferase n=1 Tax=Dehalobacterium formicoaceticum TaxID=51515 RepID=A0ABT1YAD9_9FIRM|nr:gephyrin-like molybdotransferase Glp [Dehalobacterium formicoaceticum]MCR6546894.1 molybdopterin molybdotransferase MoeA [Dehalobacterium formicoaceticum]
MKTNISLEEALEQLLAYSHPTEVEMCPLNDALGRILGEDLTAQENIPPFDRSPYDGFAFRAADTATATKEHPVTIEVIEEIPAGHAPQHKIRAGQGAKILTGAAIPEGADLVVPFEKTVSKENYVTVFHGGKSGENIVPAGEDIRKGTVFAQKGLSISPPMIGLMASLGFANIPVYRKPRIAVFSSGDELMDVSEQLAPGKIRNSNSYTLMGYIKEIGAEPIMLGLARDRVEDIADLMRQGLAQADMVISTGGVSVGDYDVVKDAYPLIGAETLYWKVKMKPGSPTAAAVKDGKILLGLSGNPASAMVIFQLLGMPSIKKMAGQQNYLHEKLEVALKQNFHKQSSSRRFLRGRLTFNGGKLFLDISGEQGNGVLSSMVGSNLLADIPAGSGPLDSGQKLSAYLIQS